MPYFILVCNEFGDAILGKLGFILLILSKKYKGHAQTAQRRDSRHYFRCSSSN